MAPDGSYVLVVSTTSVTKVTLSTGETTTLVSSGITYATGISIDPTGTGDFYVSDTNANRIRGYFANGSVKFSTYVQWNAYGDVSSMMRSAIKPDGTRLYVVGSASDGTLYEFNTSTGAKTRESSLSRSTAGLNNVVVTPDGLYAFVTHSSNGYIYRVDLTAWTSSSLRPSASSTNLNFVSVSPDSSFVITSSSSQELPNYFYRQISVSAFTVMASFSSTFATPASSAIAPDAFATTRVSGTVTS
jgi:WD40 repeat protein